MWDLHFAVRQNKCKHICQACRLVLIFIIRSVTLSCSSYAQLPPYGRHTRGIAAYGRCGREVRSDDLCADPRAHFAVHGWSSERLSYILLWCSTATFSHPKPNNITWPPLIKGLRYNGKVVASIKNDGSIRTTVIAPRARVHRVYRNDFQTLFFYANVPTKTSLPPV